MPTTWVDDPAVVKEMWQSYLPHYIQRVPGDGWLLVEEAVEMQTGEKIGEKGMQVRFDKLVKAGELERAVTLVRGRPRPVYRPVMVAPQATALIRNRRGAVVPVRAKRKKAKKWNGKK